MTNDNTNNIPPENEEEEVVTEECGNCSDSFPEDELHHNHSTGQRWCPLCYNSSSCCEDCGTWVDNDYSGTTYIEDRNRNVCEYCLDNYNYCDECCEWNRDNCERCQNDSRVHDYSYRPAPLFHLYNIRRMSATTASRVSHKQLVTGIELECEVKDSDNYDDAVETAYNIFGEELVYLKHDGSLNHGFEIVSHPFDVEYLRREIPFSRLKELTDLGVRSSSTSTCGLHVHINRSYFQESPSILFRFLGLFHYNKEQWVKIANRDSAQWAEWSEQEKDNMLLYTRYMANSKKDSVRENYRRYCAINLQPTNTIELRFFRGTLKASSLAGRIEGVHAAAAYAKATRNKVYIKNASNWDAFRQWTKDEGYQLFDTYATERGV